MTPREQLLTILRGGKPDRVPWYGDLDYWANSLVKRGFKPKDFILSDDYISWHKDLGVGFYLQGYFPYKQVISNCLIREWYEGNRHFGLSLVWLTRYLPMVLNTGSDVYRNLFIVMVIISNQSLNHNI